MSVGANARWIGLSQLARVVLQLGSLTVLARLLSPADYGVMSMAVVVTTFAGLFRDLGTAAAVIQRRELSDQTLCSIFWLNLALGVALGGCIMLTASWLEGWLRLSGLAAVLVALAPSFWFLGASSVQQALMERRQAFASLARIEVLSNLVAVMLCILAALSGWGVYSLVVQTLAQSVVSSALLWASAGFRPRLLFQLEQLRTLSGFSGNLAAFNFINYFSRNADNLIIGRVLSSEALGTYSLAYRLMMFPLQNMTTIAGRALLPVLSRRQGDDEFAAQVYLGTVRSIAFLTAPGMAMMFVLRQPLVRLAFGPQWDAAAELLVWLAPVGFLQSVVSTSGTVFTAKGRTSLLFGLGVLGALLSVGSFLIGVSGGLTSLVRWYFLANLVNSPLVMGCVLRVQRLPPLALLNALWAPCLAGLSTGLVVYASSHWLPLAPADWRAALAVHGLFGLATFAALLATAFKRDGSTIVRFLRPGS